MQKKSTQNNYQRGLGIIFVIIILVLLAALATSIIWISRQKQMLVANDVREIKINQLALTALEWGKSYAIENKTNTAEKISKICDPSGDSSLSATVKIKTTTYTDANNIKRYISKINAVACSVSCGNDCNNPNYSSSYREKYVETMLDFCDIDATTKQCK